jgi:hypothetical protein
MMGKTGFYFPFNFSDLIKNRMLKHFLPTNSFFLGDSEHFENNINRFITNSDLMGNIDFIIYNFLTQLFGRIAIIGHIPVQNLIIQHAQGPNFK